MAISPKESLALMKSKRAEIFDKMSAFVAKEAEGEVQDGTVFDEMRGHLDNMDKAITRAETLQSAALEAATPVEADMDDDSEEASKTFAPTRFNINTTDRVRVPYKGLDTAVGRFAVAKWHQSAFGLDNAKKMVEKVWGDNRVSKSLTLTTAQPVIPQDFVAGEFIELLTASAVVRQLGRAIPMPNGNLTIPRQYLGSQGAYMNEGAAIPTTAVAFDNIQMTWHKYGAATYTSMEMLEFSPLAAAEIITSDLANKLALLEDNSFLNGNGTNFPVHGLINSTASGNVFTDSGSGSPTFLTVGYDLQKAEMNLRGNLVQGNDFAWICTPFITGFLKQLASTYGVYPFKNDVDNGMLNGFPIFTSTQLPTNLGASSSNQTPLILVKKSDIIIGDAYRYRLSMTTDGGLLDGGSQVNTFGQDLVAWKITNAHDFALRHNVSASIINTVNWTLGHTAAGYAEYDTSANTSASTASSAVD